MPRVNPRSITPRELQCLQHIAQGHSDKTIGAALYLSEFTVKTHVGRLFRRLGATNRAHAVAIAFELGILTVDGEAA